MLALTARSALTSHQPRSIESDPIDSFDSFHSVAVAAFLTALSIQFVPGLALADGTINTATLDAGFVNGSLVQATGTDGNVVTVTRLSGQAMATSSISGTIFGQGGVATAGSYQIALPVGATSVDLLFSSFNNDGTNSEELANFRVFDSVSTDITGSSTLNFTSASTLSFGTSVIDGSPNTILQASGGNTNATGTLAISNAGGIARVVFDYQEVGSVGGPGIGLRNVAYVAPLPSSPGGVQGNLRLWLKADAGTGVTNDNDPVATWVDQSSGGNNATQGTAVQRPTLQTDAGNRINFNPAISFDEDAGGVNQGQFFSLPDDTVPSGNSNYATYSVVAWVPSGTGFFPVFAAGIGNVASPVLMLFAEQSPLNAWAETWGGSVERVVGSTVPGGIELVSTDYQDTVAPEQQLFVDGAQVGARSSPNLRGTATTNNNIGSIVDSTGFTFNGRIAEVILYNASKLGAGQNQIESYLAIKYGITLGHDYVDSTGALIYDVTDGFGNQVFGVVRDDASGLDQRISRSGILTVASSDTPHDANLSDNVDPRTGLNAFDNDLESYVVGHNGADADQVSLTTVAGVEYEVLTRIWKGHNIGTHNLAYEWDLGGLGLRFHGGGTLRLIADSTVDGDLSDSSTTNSGLTVVGDRVNLGSFFVDGVHNIALGLQRTPTVTLSPAPATPISEAAGTTTVTATLSYPSNLPVTVNLGFTGTATGPGAAAGDDYDITAGTNVISPPF
ncbi:MAG: hypothetical protein ACR2RB_00390, partial [Gammaproteobacteria bacterium]